VASGPSELSQRGEKKKTRRERGDKRLFDSKTVDTMVVPSSTGQRAI
jgi:hypothetical protein